MYEDIGYATLSIMVLEVKDVMDDLHHQFCAKGTKRFYS